jgi:hypothetical protein
VFEAWFACHTHLGTEATLKRFGADDSAINAEYSKRYFKKHGIDVSKAMEAHKEALDKAFEEARRVHPNPAPGETIGVTDDALPALPPHDEQLLRQVVSDSIINKPGFVEAVERILARGDRGAAGERPGPLEGLRVQGDRAVGRSRRMVYHLRNVGRGDEKVGDVVPVMFHFRRVQGSWLIDDETYPSERSEFLPPEAWERPRR